MENELRGFKKKMIRRHPHVFLQENANNTPKSIDKVLEKWENIKEKERGEEKTASRLAKVPRALPALTRAYKVQKKAAEVGFDWDDVSEAFDKVREETSELTECCMAESADRKAFVFCFSALSPIGMVDWWNGGSSAVCFSVLSFLRRSYRFQMACPLWR